VSEGGASAIEGFLRGDPTIWLSVLWAGLLVGVILGVVFAMRYEQKHARQAGSLTDLAFPHELRAQNERLREDSQRLRQERDELLGVLTRLAELLEQRSEAFTKRPQ
jgi:uncharacterized membrane-anchored protein YhcB (DUF1043 family)